MNCPSKNDDVLENPGWNQSPLGFAPDLTTCEDLNGIANSRELGDADRLCCASRNLRHLELGNHNIKEMERTQLVIGEGVEGFPKGPCTRTTTGPSREHQAGLVKSWAAWLLSVLATSLLISFISRKMPTFRLNQYHPSTYHVSKRGTCESGHAQPNYDLHLHVGGLFIIFFVSSTGCGFPLLVIKFPRLRIPPSFLFGAKHFGTGVLIATAFVHLLPTAFLSLSNPCLSYFWTEGYQAMPGAIMLASIFFVTIIEMIFSPAQHVCGGNEGVATVSRPAKKPRNVEERDQEKQHPSGGTIQEPMMDSDGSMQVREIGPLRGRNTSISGTLSRYREEGQRLDALESYLETSESLEIDTDHEPHESAIKDDVETNQLKHVLTPEQIHKKAIMQCFLLEMGILFHSVFIGMSLAVAIGNDFIVLLIAIVFHQSFEGLALGVRIADIKWPARALQPWLMAIAYGLTTPGGMAIGIGIHTLYSPDSEIGLLVVGIMNAVSAGFLVFASLVELMSEDFLSDRSWQILRGKRRVVACLMVFAGAFFMSLVGAWA